MKREPLPIDEVMPRIVAALTGGSHASLVLRAPTGAGKTTRVPPALLAAGVAGDRRIVVLEPRRVAARAAARRMAAEGGWRLGSEVGFHIRFDRRAGADTRILVVTEGVLVRMLQSDPFLDGVGAVVFDEFHERNLQSDLALAMVRRVQAEAREDLAIVVMSATLEPGPIADYLGGCPVVESEGRLHPVEVRYLEGADARRTEARGASRLDALVAAGVRRALEETDGDVLAFLPGVGEIRRAAKLLEPDAERRRLSLLQLYGDLPAERQDAVLRRGDRRKVVLATNVAETSITIDGVSAVVDSGMVRELRFDPSQGLDRLELVRVSRASADQRAGRAGRQGPGLCLRLWSEHDDRTLADATTPEIRRVDLAAPALQLLAWGESDLGDFGWFEPPEPAALDRALALLVDLGALDARGPRGARGATRLGHADARGATRLGHADARGATRLGHAMARLPIHPRLARLLIAGRRAGALERAALAAALLSERDVVQRSGDRRVANAAGPSDLLDRLEAVERCLAGGYGETAVGPVHRGRAHHVQRVARQLARLAKRAPVTRRRGEGASDAGEAVLRALLAAYPDRLAKRREAGGPRGVMVGGRGVVLAESSCVRDADLFLCLDLDSKGREALVRQASMIEADWLPADQLESSVEAVFDAERERVAGWRRRRYRDLVIAEEECDPAAAPGGQEEVECVLAAAAVERLDRALEVGAPEVAAFLARIRSLAAWRPELGLPAFDAADFERLLPQLAAGKRSFAELRRAPLLEILRGSLAYEQQRALDRLAPERLEVPSGSRVRLRYEPPSPPVLAVRIQEIFGLARTPAVDGGRLPVLLHLLAPNMRPQQVTGDLASFWANTYPQVRKELRARYPKHAWPEDPLTARPRRRPGRGRKA